MVESFGMDAGSILASAMSTLRSCACPSVLCDLGFVSFTSDKTLFKKPDQILEITVPEPSPSSTFTSFLCMGKPKKKKNFTNSRTAVAKFPSEIYRFTATKKNPKTINNNKEKEKKQTHTHTHT
jgi:hypothetical protein